MIRKPQYENRRFSIPKNPEKQTVPNGTQVRCRCGVDLFGIFRDNELHIKYRGRNVIMQHGQCRIRCRSCGYENIINLKEIKVSLRVYDDETQEILITAQALKMAEDNNVLIRNIVGTGEGGKIVVADIKKALP